MILYNFNTLLRYSNKDPKKVVNYFKQVTGGSKDNYVIKIQKSESKRDSFLLNNKDLVQNSLKGSTYELFNYIYLSSKRNLADYVYKDRLWLPIELVDIPVDQNRLIELENDRIRFKYEEM